MSLLLAKIEKWLDQLLFFEPWKKLFHDFIFMPFAEF